MAVSVEGDEQQVVRHRYVVTRAVENRSLQMESPSNGVYDWEAGKQVAEVGAHVYYDLEPLVENRTHLTQTVVVDMKSPFYKALIDVLAFVSGTRGEWEEQFTEELEVFVRNCCRSSCSW